MEILVEAVPLQCPAPPPLQPELSGSNRLTLHPPWRWPVLLALIAWAAAPAPASPCFPGASFEEALELIDLEASVAYDGVRERFFVGRSDANTTGNLLKYLASESEYVRKRGLYLLERWIVQRDGPPGILNDEILPAVRRVVDGIVGDDPNHPLRVQAGMTMWTAGLIMRTTGPDRLAYIRNSTSPDSPHRDEIVRRASRELARIGGASSMRLLREYQGDKSLSRRARAEAILSLWVAESAEELDGLKQLWMRIEKTEILIRRAESRLDELPENLVGIWFVRRFRMALVRRIATLQDTAVTEFLQNIFEDESYEFAVRYEVQSLLGERGVEIPRGGALIAPLCRLPKNRSAANV